MPYIMITGSLTSAMLNQDQLSLTTVVMGLTRDERVKLTEAMSETLPSGTVTTTDKKVFVKGKGLCLTTVNKVHALLGYNVISHSMAISHTNQERMSWTLYKKSGHHETDDEVRSKSRRIEGHK